MSLIRSLRSSFAVLVAVVGIVTTGGCKKPEPPPQKLTHGAELYGRMCAVCHGANGEGYKADHAPRLAHPDFQAAVIDDFLREAINNGRQGTVMSAWAKEHGGPLTAADVNELIKFMRTWRTGPAVTLDEAPLTGDAAKGEIVFARECARCHGVRGVGGPNLHIGNPQLLTSASNGFLRHSIKKGRPGTLMPSFEQTLAPGEIEDLTALLRSWSLPPAPPPAPAPPPPIPLGPVPLNPHGPEPVGFKMTPATTPMDVIHAQLVRGARLAFLDARA